MVVLHAAAELNGPVPEGSHETTAAGGRGSVIGGYERGEDGLRAGGLGEGLELGQREGVDPGLGCLVGCWVDGEGGGGRKGEVGYLGAGWLDALLER